MTGAGIAIPLLGASGAQAADAATWDRVALCESGGLWSANSGGGYYGGLQLTQETWDEYGGKEFAERPDLASRGQQIAVAEKILADKGPGAWPRCGEEGGLGEDREESPEPDPEPEPEPSDDPSSEPPSSEPTPSPSDPAESTGPTGPSESADPSEPAEPSDPAEPSEPSDPSGGPSDPADPTPTPTPTPTTPDDPDSGSPSPTSPAPSAPESGGPGTDAPAPTSPRPGYPGYPGGPHRADPPQEPAPDDGAGTGRHRGEPDEREGRDGKNPERPSRGDKGGGEDRGGKDGQRDDYRVERGDSLSAIAAQLDVEGGWPALYEANREAVGSDPDLILPGQQLHL